MRLFIFILFGFFALSISGCGSFLAALGHGPLCPYQGVQFDFKTATSWQAIKATYGFVVPLAIVDLPFSFVVDTFSLQYADGGENCPREYR